MTAAVITTRNEAESITALVEALREQGMTVVVVDDASTDETAILARKAGAIVHVNEERIGIGPSLERGWQLALRTGAERIVQLDAGGSHDPAQARQLLEALDTADMVVGSRFLPGSQYPGRTWRARLSQLAALACNVISLRSLSDWTSGYRAFRRQALEQLLSYRYSARMHGWQIEVLMTAILSGLCITEVPITYLPGRSSFNAAVAREAIGVWLRFAYGIPPWVVRRAA